MRNRKSFESVARTLLLSLMLAGFCSGAGSQESPPGMLSQNVTMTMFKIVDQKGKKFLETQTGEMLPISGKNLDKDAQMLAVYRDNNSNYWYINKDGQPTAIPPEKVQWAINSISEQKYAKESISATANANAAVYPPGAYPAPVQQTTIVNESSNNSGSSALGVGMAAAAGGMVGGLVGGAIDGNHYYGVPYGAPVYRGGGSAHGYYVNNSGNKVYVNNEHTNAVEKQWNQQGSWDNRSNWSQHMDGSHEGWGGFRGSGFNGGFRGRR